jgi:major membrane immunogen (membrane-anchored lipoprotein)
MPLWLSLFYRGISLIQNGGGIVMKKTAIVLCMVLLVSVFMVGCQSGDNGGGDGIVGKWSLTGAEYADGSSVFDRVVSAIGVTTIDFKADGTASASSSTYPEILEGTYTQTGNTFTVTIDENPKDFTLEDGKLISNAGDTKMIFTK